MRYQNVPRQSSALRCSSHAFSCTDDATGRASILSFACQTGTPGRVRCDLGLFWANRGACRSIPSGNFSKRMTSGLSEGLYPSRSPFTCPWEVLSEGRLTDGKPDTGEFERRATKHTHGEAVTRISWAFLTPDPIPSSTGCWWVLKIIFHGLCIEVTWRIFAE